MPETQANTTVETIADAGLWQAICDGANTIGTAGEAAFEFEEDRLRVRLRGASSIAMIADTTPADAFDHYDAPTDGVVIGIDTEQFDDLLSVADGDTVEFNLNAKTRRFEFEAPGVEYDLAGIDPDAISGTPSKVPPLKDDLDWAVDVDLPVDLWERGTEIVELAGSGHGTFVAPADDDALYLEGHGDTDRSRVNLSDSADFNWRKDSPDTDVECIMSNDYMTQVVDVIDEDVVRFVTGDTIPYHVFTERCDGRIDTKLLQAPRIIKD